METTCGLCGLNKSLKQSHIIPKFVYDWIKETGTGALRGAENMNIRIQDGRKVPFLCNDCEQKFSASETYSSKIFKRIVTNSNEFEYNSQFIYFAISILWRLLKLDVLIKETDCKYYDFLLKAEVEWRNYLLIGTTPKTFNELHLFVAVDPIRDEDIHEYDIEIPEKFFQYMGRATDGCLADSEQKCMIWFKLPRLIIIAPIIGFNTDLYVNTKLNWEGGKFYTDETYILDEDIGPFLIDRAKILEEQFKKISPNQRNKMRSKTNEKWDDIQQKDLGSILRYNKKG